MDRKLLFTLVTYTALLLILYVLYLIFLPFLTSLAWALILGIVTRPLYKKLLRKLKGRETVASVAMTLLAVIAIIIPCLIGAYVVMQEAVNGYHYISEVVKPGHDFLDDLLQKPVIASAISTIKPYMPSLDIESLKGRVVEAGKEGGAHAASFLTNFAKHFFEVLGHLFFVLFFLFFIYRDGQRLDAAFWFLVPVEEDTKRLVSTTTRKALSAFVFGVLLTALAQAVVAGIGYYFAGIPSPLFFSALTAISGFIPGIGTVLVWVPCVAFLALTGKTAAAVGLTAWNVVMIVAFVDHFVRPAVMGKMINLPLVLILVGGLGGIFAFGMIGMVVGPLVLSLVYALLKERVVAEARQEGIGVTGASKG